MTLIITKHYITEKKFSNLLHLLKNFVGTKLITKGVDSQKILSMYYYNFYKNY